MTDPTWKDPLLQRWWSECVAADPLLVNAFAAADLAPYPGVSPATMLVLLCGHGWTSEARGRLRSLIDAELARGMEAAEVLRGAEWSGKSTNGGYPCCPECDGIWDVREKYPDHEPIPKWAGMVGHAPDCRLAKVIG